ncbi:MAG: exodeoxyribonuclease VII small subunit [Hyphomicrobiales bacterium]|nr:exodeoxyribonuclease VII small subunit [Hyphomicrobiales bacterium]
MTDFAKTAQGGTKEAANAVEDGDIAELPFEKALAELEAIVGRLERGDVPLEESIAIYERGEALKLRCEALLQLAEARIERITLSAQGKPTGTAPLDEN